MMRKSSCYQQSLGNIIFNFIVPSPDHNYLGVMILNSVAEKNRSGRMEVFSRNHIAFLTCSIITSLKSNDEKSELL